MLPEEKVQNLIDRHRKLESDLSSGEINKKKCVKAPNWVNGELSSIPVSLLCAGKGNRASDKPC